MIGARIFSAMSWILVIFAACVSDSEPPNTVKSLANTNTGAAVHRAPAGDDAIAGHLRLLHAEIVAAVLDEHVELLEGPAVEQDLDPLARRELAARVLSRDPLLAAAEPRFRDAADRAVRGCPSSVALPCPPAGGDAALHAD